MTIHLPEDLEHYIHDKVRSGQFATEDAAVAEAVRRFKQWELEAELPSEPETPSERVDKQIWEVADEPRASLTANELASLHVDGAQQHDHYIYGLPKRPV